MVLPLPSHTLTERRRYIPAKLSGGLDRFGHASSVARERDERQYCRKSIYLSELRRDLEFRHRVVMLCCMLFLFFSRGLFPSSASYTTALPARRFASLQPHHHAADLLLFHAIPSRRRVSDTLPRISPIGQGTGLLTVFGFQTATKATLAVSV